MTWYEIISYRIDRDVPLALSESKKIIRISRSSISLLRFKMQAVMNLYLQKGGSVSPHNVSRTQMSAANIISSSAIINEPEELSVMCVMVLTDRNCP